MTRTLITAPRTARRGEVIEIRALIAHAMETGLRVDAEGRKLPRDIIHRFTCRDGDELVFSAELFTAVATNPYLAFSIVAMTTGTLTLTWEGDNGFAHTETLALTVT
ncbi:MAG TPA: thiosulfate oxidation carrier complex protein SoxZ [Burkholderiaceae bacterium]|nr:thiosulfate oxidation carrier complex protein SoxZ [Burkholderiaceae bacterium]